MPKQLILLFVVCFLSACSVMNKAVDPYYGDFKCGTVENPHPCENIKQTYDRLHKRFNTDMESELKNIKIPPTTPFVQPAKLEPNKVYYSQPEGPPVAKQPNSKLKSFAKGGATGVALGAAGGAILSSNNPLEGALIGAALTGGVVGVSKMLYDEWKDYPLGEETREKIKKRAKEYVDCIKKAQKIEKKKGTKASLEEMQKCAAIIQDLPGLIPFKSKAIAELIKKDREEKVRKALSNIKADLVPLRVPPKIIRIFVAPYVDSHDLLFPGHLIYSYIDEGKWILPKKGESQMRLKILEPLQQ